MEKIVLNDFEVDPRLAKLMRREDWAMCRGVRQLTPQQLIPNSEDWLQKFKTSKNHGISDEIYGIYFMSVEQTIFENKDIRDPEIAILNGTRNTVLPPGDFDPTCGYLIGFTCVVDEAIFVDLRPTNGPIITYSNHNPYCVQIVTAFQSIDDFVQFYLEQHGP